MYHFHLAEFLTQSPELTQASFQFNVYCFNPRRLHAYKEIYSEEGKTDQQDVINIAERLRFGKLPPPYKQDPFLFLRKLTCHRVHLIRFLNREKNFFLSQLFLSCSSYATSKPFGSLFGHTSLALVEEFSQEELANTPVDKLLSFLIKHSKNRFRNPLQLVHKL